MADVEIGARLSADDQISPKVKTIKQQLREAQNEVVVLSEKFGFASKEAALAAEKAAKLKDAIGDAKNLTDAFNPDTKFRAFGASIQTVVGGFTALTGAMSLLGVQSKGVEETLLKVQSALALSQGISQLQEGLDSLRNLKTMLVNTLGKSGAIGIAIAGVAALGYAIWNAAQGTDELAKSEEELQKGLIKATKEIKSLQNNLRLAKEGVISKKEALDEYNKSIGAVTGSTNDLNEAERLTSENASKYIQVQGLKAQANYLLNKSAEASAELEIKRAQALDPRASGALRAELFRQMKEDAASVKVMEDAIDSIDVKLKSIKFSITTSGLGAGIGGGAKDVKKEKEKTQKEEKESDDAFKKAVQQSENEYYTKQSQDEINRAKASKDIVNDLSNYTVTKKFTEHDVITGLDDARTHNEMINSELRQKLNEEETKAKLATAEAVGNALTSLGNLLGDQTAAGKVLGIAGAVINTYVGATKALAQGGLLGIASAAAVIASGLASVKKIIAVKVPRDKGSSGANVGSVSSPLKPQLAQATSTRLDQQQLNQIGNATARAFVLETDMTTNQERIRRLNRAARL